MERNHLDVLAAGQLRTSSQHQQQEQSQQPSPAGQVRPGWAAPLLSRKSVEASQKARRRPTPPAPMIIASDTAMKPSRITPSPLSKISPHTLLLRPSHLHPSSGSRSVLRKLTRCWLHIHTAAVLAATTLLTCDSALLPCSTNPRGTCRQAPAASRPGSVWRVVASCISPSSIHDSLAQLVASSALFRMANSLLLITHPVTREAPPPNSPRLLITPPALE